MSVIDYRSPTRVLVSVKGHPYERDEFFAMFEAMDGVAYTAVEQPACQHLLAPALAAEYDAHVFYDMPGLDFSTQPPQLVAPSATLQADFLALLEAGHGCVFLHHAIAAWPTWDEYAEIVGGRFLYLPAPLRGQPRLDSGYVHSASYQARVLQAHPVTADVPMNFAVTDELYLYEVFDDSVIPLLASDFSFTREQFFSATQAVAHGAMYSRDNWPHGPGSPLIGWVKSYKNSPIVYLQPGDGPSTYQNPHYRQLLANAIRWVSSDAAHQWARARNLRA